jgi:hypothetical protein
VESHFEGLSISHLSSEYALSSKGNPCAFALELFHAPRLRDDQAPVLLASAVVADPLTPIVFVTSDTFLPWPSRT